jgi:hypothetical protein
MFCQLVLACLESLKSRLSSSGFQIQNLITVIAVRDSEHGDLWGSTTYVKIHY